MVEHEAFRDLLVSINASIEKIIPSRNTLRGWIIKEYQKQQALVKDYLQESKSLIHLSFDLWTSPSNKALLGVVAHFIDHKGKSRTFLIGLRELVAEHSGENQAELIINVINDYNIAWKLGYFVMDNATNNDTAVRAVIKAVRPDLDWKERRIRCAGHILNLSAHAFLFGKAGEAFEHGKAVDKAFIKKEQDELDLWRRSGPVGKLHNVVTYIRRTPQRRYKFKAMSSIGDPQGEVNSGLMVLGDQDTRWNSVYYSIKRAIKLQYQINLFCDEASQLSEYPLPMEDVLTFNDWAILTRILAILEPFEHATKKLQENNKTGNWGSIWNVVPAFEPLLSHLEEFRLHHLERRTFINGRETYLPDEEEHIGSASNMAWKKLTEYYNGMETTHAYTTAIILHPLYRLAFLQAHWGNKDQDWYHEEAERKLRKAWKEWIEGDNKAFNPEPHSTITTPREAPIRARSSNIFDDWDSSWSPTTFQPRSTIASELDAYLTNGYGFKDYKKDEDLFSWWISHEKTFPNLTSFALSILSIPAMEAECERVFSSAKLLIVDNRNSLDQAIIEAIECIRAWWKRSIIRF